MAAKGQLLIVDDETNLLNVLSFMLKPHAEKILTAETAMEAIQLIETVKVDCIICDVNLPRMKGIEVLRHLRKTGQTVPLFFFSAEHDPESIKEAIALGASDYFFKPQIGRLEKAVRTVLDFLPYRPDPESDFVKLRGY